MKGRKLNPVLILFILVAVFFVVYNLYPLFGGSNPGELKNLNNQSYSSKTPVIYYFWLQCTECESTNKAVSEAAEHYRGKIEFRLINVVTNKNAKSIANMFGVKYVPYLVFLDGNGNLLKKKGGETSYREITEIIENLYPKVKEG